MSTTDLIVLITKLEATNFIIHLRTQEKEKLLYYSEQSTQNLQYVDTFAEMDSDCRFNKKQF